MVGALFCPIWRISPIWFHCTMFRWLCCFHLITVLENCHSDTLHNISRHKLNLQPYFKIACVKSVLWPALISNIVNVSLSGGSLGYWTACNNFKRHFTLPYCVIVWLFKLNIEETSIVFTLQKVWWSGCPAWPPPQLNSLWPNDAIWRQRSGSTLAQVMACCLTAPSHYLNQCWLIISEVQWHSY